MLPETRR